MFFLIWVENDLTKQQRRKDLPNVGADIWPEANDQRQKDHQA
jgi:hypothetical protein